VKWRARIDGQTSNRALTTAAWKEAAMAITTLTTTPITQEYVESARPNFAADGKPRPRMLSVGPNLFLQITPGRVQSDGSYSLSKSWVVKYSLDGKRGTISLGTLASLSLADAHVEALAIRKQVARKEDPAEQRRQERRARDTERNRPAAITFAAAAAQYAADKIQPRSGEARTKKWLRIFAIHAPELSAMLVGEVDRSAVKRALKPLWDGKHTKTGKDLRGRIEQVLTWAIAEGHRDEDAGNPAVWKGNLEASFARPSEVRPIVNHPALHYSKAGAFMVELRSKDWLGAKATEFAILTVARANEVIGMRWGEVDWSHKEGPRWTCPAKRMKKRRDHIVPLSKAAQAVLRAIQGDRTPAATDLVFVGTDGQLAENALLKSVQRIDPTVTQHGFRSTFSDWRGDRTEFSSEIAEFALAHRKDGTEGAYHRATSIAKRHELMEAWADYLAVVEGENVVTLKDRRA
jgi:integrase